MKSTKSKQRLDAAVFRAAAKRIEDGRSIYACHAIQDSNGTGWEDRHSAFFAKLFKTKGARSRNYGWFGDVRKKRNELARILALELAALIVEDGGEI